jgi:hypothetical protein
MLEKNDAINLMRDYIKSQRLLDDFIDFVEAKGFGVITLSDLEFPDDSEEDD